MVIFRYRNIDFKNLKSKLKNIFTECKNDENFQKYHNILDVFIEIIDLNDDFLKYIDQSLDNHNIESLFLNKRFSELNSGVLLYENLKKDDIFGEISGIKINIINDFFAINYECFCWYFFHQSTTQNNNFYYTCGDIIDRMEINIIHLEAQTVFDIVNIARLIPKNTYNNYMKINDEISKNLVNINSFIEKTRITYNECENLKLEIQNIENSLQNQRQEFNFIGLSNAFQKMKDDKSKELIKEKRFNWFLMLIIVISLILKIVLSFKYVGLGELNLNILMTVITSFIVFIGVLLYFFRISLYNVKAIQSQILQLDLRLSLCQFIHNYATDSKEMRENMKESLERFESVIFAPIVATDDKIPATLDGMEQLGKLIDMVK